MPVAMSRCWLSAGSVEKRLSFGPSGTKSTLATPGGGAGGGRAPVCPLGRAGGQDRLSLAPVRLAGIELEGGDAGAPVEASGRCVILLGVPEGAVVRRIHGHGAVVAPAIERLGLHPGPVQQDVRAIHGAQRVAGAAADQV